MVLLFAGVPPAGAQVIADISFLPQTYYVGDRVEARVVVRTPNPLALTIPDTLPSTEWVTIHDVAVLQRGGGVEIRILFQPFFTGTRQLPTIGLGPLELTGINAFVSPLPGREEPDIQPIRDQVFLPGTRLMVALTAFMLLGLPVLIFLTSRWTRRIFARIYRWYRERRPYRRLMKNLRVLQGEMHELDSKAYYIRLLDEARAFLDSQYDGAILSATTGELSPLLQRAGVDDEMRATVVELFQFGDLVKFAYRTVTLEDRTRHLDDFRRLAQTVYRQREERHHVGV